MLHTARRPRGAHIAPADGPHEQCESWSRTSRLAFHRSLCGMQDLPSSGCGHYHMMTEGWSGDFIATRSDDWWL